MSESLELGYQVCVTDTPADRQVLGRLLEKALKIPRPDAMRYAAATPGVLPMRMSEASARGLAEQLHEIGLDAESLPAAEIPRLADAELVHHVRCVPEGLEVLELHASPERIVPWADVEMIAVGELPDGLASRFIDDEVLLTAARRLPRSPTSVHLTHGPELWIVTRETMKGLRIHHNQMNYEYLGDRLAASSAANFRRFIEDVARNAPQAFCPPATRACLAQCSPALFTFDSPEEFERWSVLHLLNHRWAAEHHGSAASAGNGTPPTSPEVWHCLHCGRIQRVTDVGASPICCELPMTLAAGDLQRCW